jgi:prepilin peptidase CpaA
VNNAHAASLLIAALACITDLRQRRIPNALTLGAALVAIIFHGFTAGWTGLTFAAAGWVVGLLLFLPLFALRGIGGGDVKLLAALGAWLGPGLVVWLALWSAVVGGVFALVVSAWHGYTSQAFRNVWGMLSYWRVMGIRPHPGISLDRSSGPRVPYALPMAAGLGITLWLR